MNLSEIKTFLTVVETGSLVQASNALNVAQSTVTARLKALEDELGQILLIRQKSGATLTPAGMRLLRYAETINDLWQQARQETALPDRMQSASNLACHPDLWPQLTDRLFGHVSDTQPRVALSIWTGGQADMASWLDAGRVDIAISYWPSAKPGRDSQLIAQDDIVLVGDRPDRPIRFDQGYVYVENGEAFGRDHAIAYADADTARLSFGMATLGCAHILERGGSAYLPHRIAQPYLDAGQLHPIPDAPRFQRNIYLIGRNAAMRDWDWLEGALDAALER